MRIVDAEACGRRVTEHDEPDRLARAGAVATRVDGGRLEARADDAPGQGRFDAQHAVGQGAEGSESGHPDPATEGSGLGDPACASCPSHERAPSCLWFVDHHRNAQDRRLVPDSGRWASGCRGPDDRVPAGRPAAIDGAIGGSLRRA